jgi:hypothetical protein
MSAAAQACASPKPIPVAPPVMNATFPSSAFTAILCEYQESWHSFYPNGVEKITSPGVSSNHSCLLIRFDASESLQVQLREHCEAAVGRGDE